VKKFKKLVNNSDANACERSGCFFFAPPGYSCRASVLNLVCYLWLCEGMRAGAGSLCSIVHVDVAVCQRL